MQIDFAMNIYAACEAFGGAGEEMWGSAWDARAAARPPFPWNHNWNIYNLRVAAVLVGRGVPGAVGRWQDRPCG